MSPVEGLINQSPSYPSLPPGFVWVVCSPLSVRPVLVLVVFFLGVCCIITTFLADCWIWYRIVKIKVLKGIYTIEEATPAKVGSKVGEFYVDYFGLEGVFFGNCDSFHSTPSSLIGEFPVTFALGVKSFFKILYDVVFYFLITSYTIGREV